MKIALALLLTSIAGTASADSWICVAESATGFTEGVDGLVSTPYKAGRTYIVRVAKPEDEVRFFPAQPAFVFETVGDENGPYAFFDVGVKIDGYVVPSVGGSVNVEFNPSTLKFTLLSTYVYIFQISEQGFYPFLEIGSCSEM